MLFPSWALTSHSRNPWSWATPSLSPPSRFSPLPHSCTAPDGIINETFDVKKKKKKEQIILFLVGKKSEEKSRRFENRLLRSKSFNARHTKRIRTILWRWNELEIKGDGDFTTVQHPAPKPTLCASWFDAVEPSLPICTPFPLFHKKLEIRHILHEIRLTIGHLVRCAIKIIRLLLRLADISEIVYKALLLKIYYKEFSSRVDCAFTCV